MVDESAALELTYFNQSYLKNTFHVGESYTFYGTVEGTLLRRTMTNPVFEREGLHAVTGCIVPVYPLTAGVGQSLLHRAIRQGLDEGADRLPDLLPAELRRQHGLCDVRYAYENIHFPTDDAALAAARRRLAFEELYFLTLGLRLLRGERFVDFLRLGVHAHGFQGDGLRLEGGSVDDLTACGGVGALERHQGLRIFQYPLLGAAALGHSGGAEIGAGGAVQNADALLNLLLKFFSCKHKNTSLDNRLAGERVSCGISRQKLTDGLR